MVITKGRWKTLVAANHNFEDYCCFCLWDAYVTATATAQYDSFFGLHFRPHALFLNHPSASLFQFILRLNNTFVFKSIQFPHAFLATNSVFVRCQEGTLRTLNFFLHIISWFLYMFIFMSLFFSPICMLNCIFVN